MQKSNSRIKNYVMAAIVVALGVILDQWTKVLAIKHLKDQAPYVIWEGVFKLQYLENRGAAFGMFQNKQIFFIFSAILIFSVALWFYMKVPMTKRFLPLRLCAILVCAGGIGNLIDRLKFNYVVDFFYFELIDFPIFNVADIYVTVSAFVLAFLIMFYYKEDELEEIFHSRKR